MKNQHKHLLARLLVGAFLILGIGFWTTKFVVVDAANRNVGGTLAWNNQTQFLNSGFWSHSPTTGDIIKALYGSGGEASIYTQNWSGYDYNTCLSGGMNVVYTGEIPTIVADNTIYVIDSGTYTVSSSIEMANCSALISSGTVTLSDGVGLDQIIFIYNKSNVIIENMEMTNGSSGPGLYITQSTNFSVNKNKIYDNVYGGRIERSSYGQISNTEIYNITGSSIDGLQLVDANHIYANDISVHDGDANGVYLDASDNNSLTNIQSYHNGNFGIDMAESNDNSFANVQLHDNDSVGIYISTSSGNSLHSISAYNNANAGIVLANSTGSTLSGAISHDNVAEGIYVSASNGNSLTNVQSYNNAENGILVENNSDYNSLTNIQAYSNTVDGIYMFNSSDNSLGNIFAYENANGVEIRNGVGNDLSSIVSTNNSNNGFTLNGSTSSTISNVTTSGNAQAGVFLVRSPNNTLTGIVTYDNTNYGIYLGVDSDNNIITGAQAYNNNYGIYITEANSGLLNHIKTYNNYMDGIYMLNTSNTNLLTNLQSYDNIQYGIHIESSDANDFSGMILSGNLYGAYLDQATNGSLTNVQAHHNANDGIYILNAPGNTLDTIDSYNNANDGINIESSNDTTGNNIRTYNNDYDGIYLLYASDDYLQGIVAHNNNHGIRLDHSSYIALSGIVAYSNIQDGIYLNAAPHNSISNTQAYNNTGNGLWLNTSSDNNNINNAQLYNNNFGLSIDTSLNNSINNVQTYNNIYGISVLDSASNNAINNSQIYNNGYGLDFDNAADNNVVNNSSIYNNTNGLIITDCTNTIVNKLFSYNNIYGIYSDSSTITYYGENDIFANSTGIDLQSSTILTTGSSTTYGGFGWTTGSLVQTGILARDSITNPINISGNYLLSRTGTFVGMRGQRTNYLHTLTDKYSFGSTILTQIQPVNFSGTSLITGGTFDGNKFIGSSVAKINGALTINEGLATHTTGVTITLLGSSSPYYKLFGNIVAEKSGSLSTSVTTGLILSSGDGRKTVIAQIRTNNIWATHYADTIVLDTIAPTFTATLANGNAVSNGGYYNTTGVKITFADADISGATIDGAAYMSGTWITGDATYSFIVSDFAGNSTGITFTIDTTNPVLTGSQPLSGDTIIQGNTIPFTWTSAEPNISGYQLFVMQNGSIFATGATTGATTYAAFIPNNTGYSRYVISTDKAGNTGTFVSPISFAVNVPLSGIVALSGPTLITIGGNKWTKDIFPVYLRPNKACNYSITGDNIISQTGIYTGSLGTTINITATGSDGLRTLYVYLFTGNESRYVVLTGTLDTTVPTVPTLSSPASGTVIASSTATLSWAAATDGAGIGLSGYRWYVSDTDAFGAVLLSGFVASPSVSATPDLTQLPTLTGTYYWKIRSMDKLGRTNESLTRAFYYSGADYTPNSFSFDAVANATLNRTYLSSTETVTGMSAGVYSLARVTKGILYIDGDPVGITGLVTNGDTVNIELISSNEYDDVIYSTLAIGGFSTSSFRITTKVDPGTIDNSLDNGISSNLSTTQELQIVSIFLSLKDMYSDESLRTTFFTTLMNSLQNQIDSLDATNDADKIDALQYLYDVIDSYLGGTNGTNDTTSSVFVGNSDRYVAPNGRVYQITHNGNTYTSPDFIFKKTFTTLDAMKAYIDVNNGGSYGGTSVGTWNTATVDQTWQSAPYVAPNGKSYRLFKTVDGRYSSYNFASSKYFVSVESMKSYINQWNK